MNIDKLIDYCLTITLILSVIGILLLYGMVIHVALKLW